MEIDVLPAKGGYVQVDSFELNQDDAQMDYDETIDLGLNVKNIGVEEARNVTLELSTDSDYIRMIDSLEMLTLISVEEIVNLDKAFQFYVTPDTPNETKINFVLTCTDEHGSYKTDFTIEAYENNILINTVNDALYSYILIIII